MPKLQIASLITVVLLAWVLAPVLKASTPQSADILMQALGGTADLAASGAYREADVYFHGGVMDEQIEAEDKSNTRHARVDRFPSDLPLAQVISRLQNEIAPKEHKHLSGNEAKEMLPWFIVAVRLNPHLIEAWRTGSYWFFRTGDYKEAFDMISDGIRKNPDDYRLYYDRGVLYHRLKLWNKAIGDFNAAERLWGNNSEDAPYDKRGIETFLRDSIKHRGK